MTALAFIAGLMIGCIVATFAMACCVVAGRADEIMEKQDER